MAFSNVLVFLQSLIIDVGAHDIFKKAWFEQVWQSLFSVFLILHICLKK